MKISIIIRAYNEEQHIGRLLRGIREQTLDPFELLVVDSGSTDRTVAIAQSQGARILSIAPHEFTFGGSLNLGLENAAGEVAVLASAHVYPVYPDWLERLTGPFADPQVGLVYGKQRGDERTRFSEHQLFARWYPDSSESAQGHTFCNNANAAIRRNLWTRRPYSESLPGLEDIEWATWLRSQGFVISYSAEAEVRHVHNETVSQIYNRYRREAMGLRQIHPEQRFSLIDFARFALSNSMSDLRAAARQKAWAREWAGILQFRLAQFWGTYRGSSMAGPLSDRLRETFYYPHRTATEALTAARSDMRAIEYDDTGELVER